MLTNVVSQAGIIFSYGLNQVTQVAQTIAGDSTGLLAIPLALAFCTLGVSLFKRLARLFTR